MCHNTTFLIIFLSARFSVCKFVCLIFNIFFCLSDLSSTSVLWTVYPLGLERLMVAKIWSHKPGHQYPISASIHGNIPYLSTLHRKPLRETIRTSPWVKKKHMKDITDEYFLGGWEFWGGHYPIPIPLTAAQENPRYEDNFWWEWIFVLIIDYFPV